MKGGSFAVRPGSPTEWNPEGDFPALSRSVRVDEVAFVSFGDGAIPARFSVETTPGGSIATDVPCDGCPHPLLDNTGDRSPTSPASVAVLR